MPRHKKRKHHRKALNIIDLWSVPHFLFGVVVALVALVAGIPLIVALLITLVLAILWELVEMEAGLRETRWNVLSDILLPLLANPAVFFFAPLVARDLLHRQDLLFVSVIVYAALTYFSWEARANHEKGFLN